MKIIKKNFHICQSVDDFLQKFHKDAASGSSICKRNSDFKGRGYIYEYKQKPNNRPLVSKESVEGSSMFVAWYMELILVNVIECCDSKITKNFRVSFPFVLMYPGLIKLELLKILIENIIYNDAT